MKRFILVLLLVLSIAPVWAVDESGLDLGNGRVSGLYAVSVATTSVIVGTVTNASWTAVPLTEVVYDPDATISGASFTCPISGLWLMNCRTKISQGATADAAFAEVFLRLFKNGVRAVVDESLVYSNGRETSGDQGLRHLNVLSLNKGDVISYSVSQSVSAGGDSVLTGMSASFVLLREQ